MSLVTNIRRPSSLKNRWFPLDMMPHFLDGLPPLSCLKCSASTAPPTDPRLYTNTQSWSHACTCFNTEDDIHSHCPHWQFNEINVCCSLFTIVNYLEYIVKWVVVGFFFSVFSVASACWYTFKVLLEEVRVGDVRHRTVRSRVARVTHTVAATDTSPMSITHVLTLWANVDVVQSPCWRSRTGWEEALIPTEPHWPIRGQKPKMRRT